MKPLRIFIFFTAVALLLLLLALLIPRQGISITPGIRIRFMRLSEFPAADSVPPARTRQVEELVARSSVTDDPEEGFMPDTAGLPSDSAQGPYIPPANADSLKQSIYRIQFPENGQQLLEPFFDRLDGLLDGSVARTRILHFGDSQIENDRMTALIRFRLQKQFGGTGTGLVHAVPLYSGNMAYRQELKGDWRRYTFFGTRDSTITHNAYGIMGAFAAVPLPLDGNWPILHYSFNLSRRTGQVDRVRVFLHSYIDSVSMAFVVNDSLCDTIRGIPGGFSVADYRQHEPIREMELCFNLKEGGRIYGISFESHEGLQMDNIAMRGGSGLIFTKMDREQQLRMLEYLSPGLLILQYGGNVVPYINAERYGRSFRKELECMKDLCPGIPVIVVGPSDMSRKEKGAFITYPNIEPVRDALKEAALASGCAFWDLYEAMGGYNSMPSFVQADPPLASTDYIHFTALGVNLVAEMFYNALMLEYRQHASQSPAP